MDGSSVCVVFYGEADNAETDEIKGFFPNEQEANEYCETRNILAPKGVAYWWEKVQSLVR